MKTWADVGIIEPEALERAFPPQEQDPRERELLAMAEVISRIYGVRAILKRVDRCYRCNRKVEAETDRCPGCGARL